MLTSKLLVRKATRIPGCRAPHHGTGSHVPLKTDSVVCAFAHPHMTRRDLSDHLNGRAGPPAVANEYAGITFLIKISLFDQTIGLRVKCPLCNGAPERASTAFGARVRLSRCAERWMARVVPDQFCLSWQRIR